MVVPHTHWDREWYAPFETMRFHLLRFLDELVEVLEAEPDLPAFLLDGQVVMLEDYLEVRTGQRERVHALVSAGRLRPGPFYVQPDEFHLSGEALVRNLLVGVAASLDFGWVMREGYLPDTFGHVAQLPQILRGFGVTTFYAMRGFGAGVEQTGSQFWWEAPDGSRVRVEWLSESYSNAAVLAADPKRMALNHGVLVSYDSLPELLDRLSSRSVTGVVLLLNGGDHLRVQADVPRLVRSLDAGVPAAVQLGGLEEFSRLVDQRAGTLPVFRGELHDGARHDVFDGIASTRTPLKVLSEQTEAYLTGVAERLDALAALVDGRTSAESLHYAWRELLKNYAHDSICGCSVDAVHDEMVTRFTKVGQVARAVAEDALARLAVAAARDSRPEAVPIVVVNPSAFARTDAVDVDVVFDLTAPMGRRQFGWVQRPDSDTSSYHLLDSSGVAVPFTVVAAEELVVADALNRRKELLRHRLRFRAAEVPPLGTAVYSLAPAEFSRTSQPAGVVTHRDERVLENEFLRVEVEPEGTLRISSRETGRSVGGLLELLDDGDAGDEYGFGPLAGDWPLSSRTATWTVRPGADRCALVVTGALRLPVGLTPDRSNRSVDLLDVPVVLTIRLAPGADRADVDVWVDNRARDHRIRLRFPSGVETNGSTAETAYGIIRRDNGRPDASGWHERPSGVQALRRFVALEDADVGLQILTEGLYEYSCPQAGLLDVTLLRAVGWLARLDHPLRPHKIGPQLSTPGAQCLGEHTFRLAIRPYVTPAPAGHLFRAAEQFSVPLQGWAVQGHPPPSPNGCHGPAVGLAVDPSEVVLSAVKTAEDGGPDLVVRVFNSAPTPVTATLQAAFRLSAAHQCSLEETDMKPLTVRSHGKVDLPLAAGQIATVRLRRSPAEGGSR